MRIPLVCLFVLAGLVTRAEAWSPAPFTLEHCVQTYEVAVRGTVSKVEVVDRKAGGWVLSRATLDVERVYHGIAPAPKQLTFFYWSATDNALTLPHKLGAKDRILVFLSTNLDPVKGMKTDAATKHMLQFAKANHRGYLFEIGMYKGADTLRDSIFSQDASQMMTLTAAEAVLAKRKP